MLLVNPGMKAGLHLSEQGLFLAVVKEERVSLRGTQSGPVHPAGQWHHK